MTKINPTGALAYSEARVAALREAVEYFESEVGVEQFAELSTEDGKPWAHIAESWEHQGPYMSWLRARADREAKDKS